MIAYKFDGRIQFSTTFQGHSLCSAIALAVFDYVAKNNLVQRAVFLDSHISNFLSNGLSDAKYLANIRGKGIRISLENSAPDHHLFSIELGNRLSSMNYLVSSSGIELAYCHL